MLNKSPNTARGFTLAGLPDSDTPLCQCIATSGGFERCPKCGTPGRTKKNIIGGAPSGFYEFCGHKILENSPHYRDHRFDFSLHTEADCKIMQFRTGRATPS